jgi:4-carboxymuconolactone decarboxylase
MPSYPLTVDLLPGVDVMTSDYPQRIPYPFDDGHRQGIYGELTNGQRMTAHLPPAIEAAIRGQSQALLRDGRIRAIHRELVIVRVGYLCNCIYEVEQHRSIAVKLGVPKDELDQLAYKHPALAAPEAALIAFVDQLIFKNRPDDSVLSNARCHFTDGEILEVLFVAGNWWTIARLLETCGVPLDQSRIGERPLGKIKQ